MWWRVFYRGGETFNSTDGPPEDAPGGGVVAVVQEDDSVGVQVHEGGTGIFVFDLALYGGWYNLDWFGLTQYLLRPGKKIIKLGEVMSTAEYKALLAAIREDPWLPAKSARYPWERQF